MAHIKRFRITGLAGRSDVVEQKLNRNLNVFFGLNGSGKTSLLRILESAMEGDARTITTVPFESASVTIYSVTHKRTFTRKIARSLTKRVSTRPRRRSARKVVARLSIDERHKYADGVDRKVEEQFQWVSSSADAKNTRWQHRFLPTERLYLRHETIRGFERAALRREVRDHSPDPDAGFAQGVERLWTLYSNILLSQVKDIQEEGLTSMLRSVLIGTRSKGRGKKSQKLDSETAYSSVSMFLKRRGLSGILGSSESFARNYSDDLRVRRVVDEINAIEQKIEDARASRNKLEQLIRDMFTGSKTVTFSDTGISVESNAGVNIGLTSLSSGEKHTLAIFIETLLADINTFMIDEPEISLHVDWQNRLISAMRLLNPDAQLILATHSPEIMADVADENIYRL